MLKSGRPRPVRMAPCRSGGAQFGSVSAKVKNSRRHRLGEAFRRTEKPDLLCTPEVGLANSLDVASATAITNSHHNHFFGLNYIVCK